MTTNHDFEWLSAYLDNQLPAAERAALEARLAREPELRATLRDLRLTVQALRTLPAVKLPRSFTLTPAQVGGAMHSPRQPRAPLLPVLRFATALSALALVIVLAGDIGGGLLATSRQADTASGEVEVALMAATETAEELQPVEAPAPSETPLVDLESMAGAGADDGTEATEDADLFEESSLVAPEAAVTPTPTEVAERTMAPTPEASPKSVQPETTPPSVADAPPSPTDDLFYSTDANTEGALEQTTVTNQPRGGLSPVRVIELALVILTVLLGAALWFTRRNA
jgi:hypothetical protein